MSRCRALIYEKNLLHNIKIIKKLSRPDSLLCPAVKADAYGHGLIETARILLSTGIGFLGVAESAEGIILREAGIGVPLIVFGLQQPQDIKQAVAYDLTLFASDAGYLKCIEREARKAGRRTKVHLKVDTGMGRIGCRPDEAPDLAACAAESENLILEGVATHFPAADGSNPAYTEEQIRLFSETVGRIRSRGIDPPCIHAANSGGITGHPASLFTMVRPGIMLYGYPPSAAQKEKLGLLPVMEFESNLVLIKKVPAGSYISYGLTYKTPRKTFIGTVSAGYGDGYFRLLSNKARVLIRGDVYPVVGRICMDQFMVDLGPETDLPRYCPATLFGPDPAGPDAADLAEIIGTIPYEVTCAVSARVPRIRVPLTRPRDGAD